MNLAVVAVVLAAGSLEIVELWIVALGGRYRVRPSPRSLDRAGLTRSELSVRESGGDGCLPVVARRPPVPPSRPLGTPTQPSLRLRIRRRGSFRCVTSRPCQDRGRAGPPSPTASPPQADDLSGHSAHLHRSHTASFSPIGLPLSAHLHRSKSEFNDGRLLGTPAQNAETTPLSAPSTDLKSAICNKTSSEFGPFEIAQGPKWRCPGAQVTPRPPRSR